jgi:hypothetical protein
MPRFSQCSLTQVISPYKILEIPGTVLSFKSLAGITDKRMSGD